MIFWVYSIAPLYLLTISIALSSPQSCLSLVLLGTRTKVMDHLVLLPVITGSLLGRREIQQAVM